jgi:hypothetical protein
MVQHKKPWCRLRKSVNGSNCFCSLHPNVSGCILRFRIKLFSAVIQSPITGQCIYMNPLTRATQTPLFQLRPRSCGTTQSILNRVLIQHLPLLSTALSMWAPVTLTFAVSTPLTAPKSGVFLLAFFLPSTQTVVQVPQQSQAASSAWSAKG